MALQYQNNFSKGVNLDFDELRIPQDVAVWIKDCTIGVNTNASTPAQSGSNMFVRTPSEGNTALTVSSYPSGTNYCIGTYSSEQTNELYYFLYNSSNNHSIWVINGDTGAITKVYQGSLLPFVLDPQYFISEGRCTIELRSVVDPVTKKETEFKFLIFANNYANQFLIEVNSSIATNSFSTTYFTSSSSFYNPLELIHLGVPTPLKAIGLNTPTAYSPTSADLTIQNMLVRNGWQFRVKFIDIFGRESEHGIISSQYITLIGGTCLQTSNGLPRCVVLNFDAGNPLVNQIQVEYRRWVGNDHAGALATGWMIYEVFNKYDNSASVPWYTRSINPLFSVSGSGISFTPSTNLIAYTFCGDKNSVPIDPNETSRTEPELPRISAGVFSINKRIGLPNNVRGFQPIAPSVVDKVVFGVQLPPGLQPGGTPPCQAPPTRTVVFYMNLYEATGDFSCIIRKSYGTWVFGNSDHGPCGDTDPTTSSFKLDQIFADQQNPGFIGYLANTPYGVISEFGDFDPVSGVFTPTSLAALTSGTLPARPMFRFTLTDVPAGKYIARIASHHATINDADYQKTSTYVAGVLPVSTLPTTGIVGSPAWARQAFVQNPYKEILIDCSTGDVNLNQPTDPYFLCLDLGDQKKSGAIDGYLYEEPGGAPVEMNPVVFWGGPSFGTGANVLAFGSFFTDHNGFFFATCPIGPTIRLYTDICDGSGLLPGYIQLNGHRHSIQHGNGSSTPAGACWGVNGDPTINGALYLTQIPGVPSPYPAAARRVIKQRFVTCTDPNVGTPGIPIVMTKCGGTITDSSGRGTLIAHNRYAFPFTASTFLSNLAPDFSTSPNNQDLLIYSQKGGCPWTACGGCDSFMADATVTYIACGGSSSGCTGTQPPRTLCLSDQTVNLPGVGLYGCQTGGKYPVAFILHDVIGRHTAPQIRQGEKAFVTMPNLNDTGYRQFALPGINVTIDPTFAVDPIFTKMTFLVGANILFTDFISLPADWVQPVDNTGETNSTTPTALRIYYGSLNEYNKQNNFSTNTGWQFITSGEPTATPREGDVVQFIMNGDGTWLTSVISAVVTYDNTGLFFTIDYLPELAGLKNNCLFRIIRPSQNVSNEFVPLYEQSLTVDLVNGVPTSLNFVLPYFDSYLLNRVMPVPRLKGQPGPISPASFPAVPVPPIQYTSSNIDTTLETAGYATNNVNNKNGVLIFQLVDDPVSYPFFFESPSPADGWGSHLACRGRVMFPNPYQKQQRIDTEIALSDALGDRGEFNGLSYYESSNVQVFDRNTWGGITAVLVETSVMLVICDRDHFVVRFNGSTVRTDGAGNLIAQNQLGIFTAPERKAGTNYGCGVTEINTIAKYAGIVHWLDTSGYIVTHNFSAADSNTDNNGYLGYILNKISVTKIRNLNPANGLTFPHGKIDPKDMSYVLTWFNLPQSGSPSYLNLLTTSDLPSNETIVFDHYSCLYKQSASYTPEYYANFPGYLLQKNFLAFKNGVPYIHHNNFAGSTPPPYANYFGTQCKPRFTFVANTDPEHAKRFLWMELYCKQNIAVPGNLPQSLFLADVITTEKGQVSRILIPRWLIKDGYSTAEFICDLNTPSDPNLQPMTGANKILDGNPLIGRWLQASIVVQDSYAGTYFELSAAKVFFNHIQQPEAKNK